MCQRSIFLMALLALLALATSVPAGLVGHWPLDGNPSDISGNGYDGVAEGGVLYADGVFGSAGEFNGSDALVNCANVPVGDTGAISVACWVKPRNIAQDWAGYVSKWTLDNSQRTFWMGQHATDGWLRFGIYPTGPAAETFVDSGQVILADEEWTHIVCTYDGHVQKIYADGAEIVASPDRNAAIVDRGGNLRIGIVATANWFNGLIDDVRVYTQALSAGQIQAVMANESYPFASGPEPGDGVMISATEATLRWGPGELAVSHDVYLGTDADAVAAATPEDADLFLGSAAENHLDVEALVPGATYYWRVDAVNEGNPDSPWKGELWSFRVQPDIAWNPTPPDGAQYVLTDQELTWEAGMNALFHTVYFGETFDEVSDAVAGGMMTATAAYNPGPLEMDHTYYWRVDEFVPPAQTKKGEVWSFTTLGEIAVTDPNLLAWWTFEEGSGMTAVDWSGHDHHGVILGGAQWADGYYGAALDFDGSDDFVEVGNPPDLPSGPAPRSICAWITTDNLDSGWKAAVAYGSPAGSQSNGFARNGALLSGFGYGNDLTVENFWQIGVWHHLCLTYDGTTATLYADGVRLLSEAKEWNLVLSRVRIGRQVNDGPEFWDGLIDDVRIYDKVLTEDEIQQIMRGDPLLAGNPVPARNAVVDIRDVGFLSWAAGDTAVSHDVYFGTDKDAVATAGRDAAEYQGNQTATSFSSAGLVAFGGGDYYWRVDEVEADGTVRPGYLWTFTVPDYLIVDDFESYSNEVGQRVFELWIDGIGFTQPEPGNTGNGTGALVGHDIWNVDSPYFEQTIMETGNVHGGRQAMPLYYDNTFASGRSEADRTFTPPQNWTVEAVTTLVVHFRGDADNTGDLYLEINGVKVPYDGDPGDIASGEWVAWEIDLASVGTSLTNIRTLTIGIEGGETGLLYVDDIILTKP